MEKMAMSHNGQFQLLEFSDEPTVSPPELHQLTMATCASNLVRSLHTHTHTQGAHRQPQWHQSRGYDPTPGEDV